MPERHPAGAPPRCETVPAPVVTGPVPYETPGGGGRDYPFLLTDVDLDSRGYVAGEFFYSGRANSYDAPVPTVNNDPAPPIAGVKSSGHPYTTRLMVYRPAEPARFTGVVFAEWTNSSSNFDNPVWWQRNHDFGDAARLLSRLDEATRLQSVHERGADRQGAERPPRRGRPRVDVRVHLARWRRPWSPRQQPGEHPHLARGIPPTADEG